MPDYKNWVPMSMVLGFFGGAAVFLCGAAVIHQLMSPGTLNTVLTVLFGLACAALCAGGIYMYALYRAFDYRGKRQMSRQIIEGTAAYVSLPENGRGLDVGCGSGALTIACAKRNPQAEMTGCDIWSGAYKAVFTKELCENNAAAEGVSNVSFQEGNALCLPFEDESFDAVASNYVYHNIPSKDRQAILMETLRVLRKGGTFAIHDLMGPSRYGDMNAFAGKLKELGYEDVRLIRTDEGMFMNKKEAVLLGLSGSALLTGKK